MSSKTFEVEEQSLETVFSRTSAKELQKHLEVVYNTANTIVQKLVSLEVLEQISEGERNKKYVYRQYMNILEQGCENF